MITTNDIEGLIAFAILNNKSGVIKAMNDTGNFVSAGISDPDLTKKIWDIFLQQGIDAFKNVVSRIPINKSKVPQSQINALSAKFNPNVNSNAKFSDWFNNTLHNIGDLIGGSSVSTGTVTNVLSESLLSPGTLALIAVLGIVLMILFRKFIGVVVGIIVIVLAVILYGIFAKKITTVQTGGGTTSHGSISNVLLSWLGL